ncbi:MAG: PAS domain-containing protein, partial [Flavobacteriales bacterium]|nr:PAS domain-containing protein [Flavobacteriales bacterium]
LINKQNEEKDIEKIKLNLPFLMDGIERLMGVEDMRLFPNAMQLLTKEDWEEFYEGDEEIGWMLKEKPTPYPEREEVYVHPSQDKKERKLSFSLEDTFHYDEGYMTPDQVNLLLRFLPVDITYVDENDKVIFYNRGEDRVFPRSKGIIGREVKFCHPPKSVHMVLRIVEEFRAGTKDLAEFWINFKGRMIHIRYFAIRDKEKKYRGVIEMSQDVTDIQKLEGQKRLLDWD